MCVCDCVLVIWGQDCQLLAGNLFKKVNNLNNVVLLKVLKVLLNLGNTGSSCFMFRISCGCYSKMQLFVTDVCDWLVEAEPFL